MLEVAIFPCEIDKVGRSPVKPLQYNNNSLISAGSLQGSSDWKAESFFLEIPGSILKDRDRRLPSSILGLCIKNYFQRFHLLSPLRNLLAEPLYPAVSRICGYIIPIRITVFRNPIYRIMPLIDNFWIESAGRRLPVYSACLVAQWRRYMRSDLSMIVDLGRSFRVSIKGREELLKLGILAMSL